MDRRDVLQLGLGGVVLAGCGAGSVAAPAAAPSAGWSPSDLDAFFRRLDDNMASIRSGNPMRDAIERAQLGDPVLSPERLRDAEDLTRSSLRSLLLAGSVKDLPDELRDHPAMVERLDRGLDEMDHAVLGMTKHLESLDVAQQRAIQQRLREQPELGMTLAESLDVQAANIGVSFARRAHLRTIASQTSWRLRSQPLSTFIEESSAKVRRVAEKQYQATIAELRAIEHFSTDSSSEEPGRYSPSSRDTHRGEATLKVGGILLGVGAGVTLAGVAITASGSFAGLFLITPGALLLLGGLITLLVGAILKATA